jgi:hypothetical protein
MISARSSSATPTRQRPTELGFAHVRKNIRRFTTAYNLVNERGTAGMSIRADILRAKSEYEEHLARHKCGTLTRCEERNRYSKAWMDTAKLWGLERDDDERQRAHYHEQFGS